MLALSLIVAGLGILIQFLVGVPGFPAIPPGPIILAVAAILVLLPRSRWPVFAGLAAALFVTIGGLVEGSLRERLGDPGTFDVWIGVVLQWAGLVAAIVSGAIAVRPANSQRRADVSRNE
jgi:hypothetical protein